MLPEDQRYFSEFLSEFQKETDRGAALVGAALLDDRLKQIIVSFLIEGKISSGLLDDANAPLHSFSSRIKMAFCLGLISKEEYGNLEVIRKVRNEFAHRLHGLSFSNEEIIKLCRKLKFPTRSSMPLVWENSARHLYIIATCILAMDFDYRPERVKKEQRVSRKWIEGKDWVTL